MSADVLKIKSGQLDILKSGVIRTGFDPNISLEIDDLKFIFNFKTIKSKKSDIDDISISVIENEKILVIDIANEDSHVVSGILEPIHVGFFRGKKIFLSFESKKVPRVASWSLEYTFFLESK